MESGPTVVDDEPDQYSRGFRRRRVEGRTALGRWLEGAWRASGFGLLSTVAVGGFPIAARSAGPGGGSSAAKRTVSAEGASCNGESVELVGCVESWVRGGGFTEAGLCTCDCWDLWRRKM